jgi:hypothetical protein
VGYYICSGTGGKRVMGYVFLPLWRWSLFRKVPLLVIESGYFAPAGVGERLYHQQ